MGLSKFVPKAEAYVVLYWVLRNIVLGPVMRLIWRPWIAGEQNIPERGGAILASNHLSFSDHFVLALMSRRRVTFLAKAEYFNTPGVKGRLSRIFFASVGQVPIDRSSATAAAGALNTGVRILASGQLLGIYPEGTRSPDGRLYKGKTGVARMALEAGMPVIPVAMVNTDKIQPTGRKLPRLRPRPGVRIGTPLDFARYEGLAGDRFVERSMTDEIMYELMRLSGQEYVDADAAKIKRKMGANLGFGADGKLSHPDPVGSVQGADRLPIERAG